MKKLMKLATSDDLKISCHTPFTEEELNKKLQNTFLCHMITLEKKYSIMYLHFNHRYK